MSILRASSFGHQEPDATVTFQFLLPDGSTKAMASPATWPSLGGSFFGRYASEKMHISIIWWDDTLWWFLTFILVYVSIKKEAIGWWCHPILPGHRGEIEASGLGLLQICHLEPWDRLPPSTATTPKWGRHFLRQSPQVEDGDGVSE